MGFHVVDEDEERAVRILFRQPGLDAVLGQLAGRLDVPVDELFPGPDTVGERIAAVVRFDFSEGDSDGCLVVVFTPGVFDGIETLGQARVFSACERNGFAENMYVL